MILLFSKINSQLKLILYINIRFKIINRIPMIGHPRYLMMSISNVLNKYHSIKLLKIPEIVPGA